jgi:energy-coupling factor transporter transmembrane protein EcfT
MLGFGADGAPSLVQMRTPPPSVLGIPNIPCSTSGYSYTILKLGPLQFTRKGLSLASTSASLSFAVCPSLTSILGKLFGLILHYLTLFYAFCLHPTNHTWWSAHCLLFLLDSKSDLVCTWNYIICTPKFVVCMQIFQSASLCLTTTTPEQLASALWWFMSPLKHIGVPVPEIILTLLLSLRFINLVFDEASILW